MNLIHIHHRNVDIHSFPTLYIKPQLEAKLQQIQIDIYTILCHEEIPILLHIFCVRVHAIGRFPEYAGFKKYDNLNIHYPVYIFTCLKSA